MTFHCWARAAGPLAFALVLALLPGCSAGDGGAGDERDASRIVRPPPDAAPPDAAPDVGFVTLCRDGETRPCGTDTGECSAGVERCVRDLWTGTCEDAVAPTEERCNGLDDDCDGAADEALGLGQRCKARDERNREVDGRLGCDLATGGTVCLAVPDCDVDADGDGFNVCQDCDDDDRNNYPGNAERCDDRDNNCNGVIDEAFPLGQLCYVGEGVCRRGGQLVCGPRGLDTVCDAVPGPPAPAELCGDGEDDDCDGRVDEGFTVGEPCQVGVGICARPGTFRCTADGTAQVCVGDAGDAAAELCGDGEDNDCDGAVDEGFDVGAPCTAGLGACAQGGTLRCSADRRTAECDATPGEPAAETCGDDRDDDCDGRVDEGFDLGAPCTAGAGACQRAGVLACAPDGGAAVCSATPAEPGVELCGDGADGDCDGRTDEGYDLGVACAVGTGACRRDGVTVCDAERTGVTCGASPGAPQIERCNGQDDDCDGRTDEGFDLGAACTAGTGACRAAGRTICAGDGGGTICDATPGPPAPELCDTVDNDCDGRVDEDFALGGACDGPDADLCARGAIACDPLTGGTTCAGDTESPEICNYLDDDCDGVADNGIDLFSDPENCGACGLACPGPGPACIDGACYRTYWVSALDGANATGDGSEARPWRTLSRALSIVRGPRARILVRPGTYSTSMRPGEPAENEAFPITMRSTVHVVGAGDRAEIVFDAGNVSRGTFLLTDLGANNLIEGLTIRRGGGGAVFPNAAAIDLRSTELVVRDVIIEDAFGGASYVAMVALDSDVLLEQAVLRRNAGGAARSILLNSRGRMTIHRCELSANTGGAETDSLGIVTNTGELTVTNSVFIDNQGPAISNHSLGARATIIHNTFAANRGSGIYIRPDTQPIVVANNVFAFNTRYGVYDTLAADPATVAGNLFWQNTLGAWRDDDGTVLDVPALNARAGWRGNVTGDPLFISLPAGNARLRAGSASVDRADPEWALADDHDGRPRPRGAVADIGAFESFFEP